MPSEEILEQLTALSHYLGDPAHDYAILGEGNTSAAAGEEAAGRLGLVRARRLAPEPRWRLLQRQRSTATLPAKGAPGLPSCCADL